MKTVAFISQKGGSGKSTLAASIAVAAQEFGERVFALDLDPQGTLYAWGERRQAETPLVDRTRVGQLHDALNDYQPMATHLPLSTRKARTSPRRLRKCGAPMANLDSRTSHFA